MAYTSVVVGSDGSPTAELAVQQAAEIAAQHGARLVIVTAYKPHGDELAQQHGVPDDMRWALTDVRQAEQKVSRGRELAAAAGAKGAVTQALAGSAADVILEAAHDYAADVIVVGSRGLTNAAHVVMGSVASSVLHHAPCDVLVVQTTG